MWLQLFSLQLFAAELHIYGADRTRVNQAQNGFRRIVFPLTQLPPPNGVLTRLGANEAYGDRMLFSEWSPRFAELYPRAEGKSKPEFPGRGGAFFHICPLPPPPTPPSLPGGTQGGYDSFTISIGHSTLVRSTSR